VLQKSSSLRWGFLIFHGFPARLCQQAGIPVRATKILIITMGIFNFSRVPCPTVSAGGDSRTCYENSSSLRWGFFCKKAMVNVYVLKSLFDGILYVGISMDIDRRIKEHNLGGSKFTSGHIPWELVYKEEMPDFKTARAREKFLEYLLK